MVLEKSYPQHSLSLWQVVGVNGKAKARNGSRSSSFLTSLSAQTLGTKYVSITGFLLSWAVDAVELPSKTEEGCGSIDCHATSHLPLSSPLIIMPIEVTVMHLNCSVIRCSLPFALLRFPTHSLPTTPLLPGLLWVSLNNSQASHASCVVLFSPSFMPCNLMNDDPSASGAPFWIATCPQLSSPHVVIDLWWSGPSTAFSVPVPSLDLDLAACCLIQGGVQSWPWAAFELILTFLLRISFWEALMEVCDCCNSQSWIAVPIHM